MRPDTVQRPWEAIVALSVAARRTHMPSTQIMTNFEEPRHGPPQPPGLDGARNGELCAPPSSGPAKACDLVVFDLFKDIGELGRGQIFAALHRKRVRQRTTLSLHRDFNRHAVFVWSGQFRLTAAAPSGAVVALSAMGPGDALGLDAALLDIDVGSGVRLIAERSGLLLHLSGADLQDIAINCPPLSRAIANALAAQAIKSSNRIYELCALDVRTRLQIQLLRLSSQAVHGDRSLMVRDAPTQAILGAQIGAAREAVARALKDMSDEGLIRFSRGMIEFLDIERLRAATETVAGEAVFKSA
jgi:CRP-like cAMP-binding protein